jgi:hypothetical protein
MEAVDGQKQSDNESMGTHCLGQPASAADAPNTNVPADTPNTNVPADTPNTNVPADTPTAKPSTQKQSIPLPKVPKASKISLSFGDISKSTHVSGAAAKGTHVFDASNLESKPKGINEYNGTVRRPGRRSRFSDAPPQNQPAQSQTQAQTQNLNQTQMEDQSQTQNQPAQSQTQNQNQTQTEDQKQSQNQNQNQTEIEDQMQNSCGRQGNHTAGAQTHEQANNMLSSGSKEGRYSERTKTQNQPDAITTNISGHCSTGKDVEHTSKQDAQTQNQHAGKQDVQTQSQHAGKQDVQTQNQHTGKQDAFKITKSKAKVDKSRMCCVDEDENGDSNPEDIIMISKKRKVEKSKHDDQLARCAKPLQESGGAQEPHGQVLIEHTAAASYAGVVQGETCEVTSADKCDGSQQDTHDCFHSSSHTSEQGLCQHVQESGVQKDTIHESASQKNLSDCIEMPPDSALETDVQKDIIPEAISCQEPAENGYDDQHEGVNSTHKQHVSDSVSALDNLFAYESEDDNSGENNNACVNQSVSGLCGDHTNIDSETDRQRQDADNQSMTTSETADMCRQSKDVYSADACATSSKAMDVEYQVMCVFMYVILGCV